MGNEKLIDYMLVTNHNLVEKFSAKAGQGGKPSITSLMPVIEELITTSQATLDIKLAKPSWVIYHLSTEEKNGLYFGPLKAAQYLNSDGSKITNFYRIVTSSFYCEPVFTDQTNTSQKAIRYRYVDNPTDLLFLTLSPSASPTNKPSATPFIGQPDQDIIITNTFFNPITIDIQIAEHDLDTIAIALYGNQTKSIEDGIYTLYDSAGNIYKQYNLYEIRNNVNEMLFEVRQDRGTNIDFSKNFTNIIT